MQNQNLRDYYDLDPSQLISNPKMEFGWERSFGSCFFGNKKILDFWQCVQDEGSLKVVYVGANNTKLKTVRLKRMKSGDLE